jgi:hypothetical protein
MRSPQVVAMRTWPASIAGIEVLPGSARPRASTMAVIVLAVPIVLQVPGERVILASSCTHSVSLTRPAWYSSQNMRVCVPAPMLRVTPSFTWRSLSIGPALQKSVGRPMLSAPITVPGVVLSQPASSTTPSTGCERSSSSTSIASRLR